MFPQAAGAYGLGVVDLTPATVAAASPAAATGAPFFPTHPGADFFRSPEFGLLVALAIVVYIDGRVLPRRRG